MKLSIIPLLLAIISVALFCYIQRKKIKPRKIVNMSLFFVFVGLAFILLELGYLNTLFLVFDSPIASFSILIFIFIFFSGIGSLIAHYKEALISQNIKWVLIILSILVLSEVLFMSNIVAFARNVIFLGQLLISILVAGIPALFVGMIFPLAVKKASANDKSIMIFVYLLDSIVSIFAGIIALVISATIGFNMLLIAGAASYILALFFISSLRVSERSTVEG